MGSNSRFDGHPGVRNAPENQRIWCIRRSHEHRPLLTLAVLVPSSRAASPPAPQVTQSNEDRCAARGHKPDSKAFSDCIASFESVRERKMDARRNEMLERSNMPAAASRN